jgi:hypothetical protein
MRRNSCCVAAPALPRGQSHGTAMFPQVNNGCAKALKQSDENPRKWALNMQTACRRHLKLLPAFCRFAAKAARLPLHYPPCARHISERRIPPEVRYALMLTFRCAFAIKAEFDGHECGLSWISSPRSVSRLSKERSSLPVISYEQFK